MDLKNGSILATAFQLLVDYRLDQAGMAVGAEPAPEVIGSYHKSQC